MQLKCRGVFDVMLIDTKSSEVKDERTGISNLLLNRWRDGVLANGDLINTISICHAGDSNTPASRTDTDILGNRLGSSNSYTVTNSLFDYPAWTRIEYSFETGTATGTIRELSIGNIANAHSRIVIDPPIEKRDTDKLIVTYTRSAYRANEWTGIISGGQIDGTDVSWGCTINNRQLYNIFHKQYLSPWLSVRSTPLSAMHVIVGDSNLPSDLANDIPVNNKGVVLYDGQVDFYNAAVHSDSYKEITFGLETGHANGEIGEIILINKVSTSKYGLCRFTFTPKLQKSENSRLYLTWRWAIADW